MRSYSPWPPPAWSWSSWLWQRSAKCLKTRRGSTAQERHRRSTAKIKRGWKTLKSTDHHHPWQPMGWMWQILSGEGGFGGRGGGWWPNRGKTDYREVTSRQNNRSTRLGGKKIFIIIIIVLFIKIILFFLPSGWRRSQRGCPPKVLSACCPCERTLSNNTCIILSSHQNHPMAIKIIIYP